MVTKPTHELILFGIHLWRYVFFVRHVLIGLLSMITIGGIAVAQVEDLSVGDGIYFAFVTGLTVGYGDIYPITVLGRFLSIALGMAGMLFTGITVAIATRALADASKQFVKDKPKQLSP